MKLHKPIKLDSAKEYGFGCKYPEWIRKWLKKDSHDGTDWSCPKGTSVFSASVTGEYVVRVGQDKSGQHYICTYLLTENNNVFFLIYRHLMDVVVKVGDFIKGGEQIGSVAVDHVHFSVYGAINPKQFI